MKTGYCLENNLFDLATKLLSLEEDKKDMQRRLDALAGGVKHYQSTDIWFTDYEILSEGKRVSDTQFILRGNLYEVTEHDVVKRRWLCQLVDFNEVDPLSLVYQDVSK